jgi:predicted nucleic acid-binding protein
VLVDTSVWIDHLRRGNARLRGHLEAGEVASHPFVVGELACGNLKAREELLSLMAALPQVPMVEHEEVLAFVEQNRLMGRGLGWIDVHLLASALLAGTSLWTLDKGLGSAAALLKLGPSE